MADKLISARNLSNVIRDDPYIPGRAFARVSDYIDDAPAVDAVEVVHGRWIPQEYSHTEGNYHLFHCSECGIPNAFERNYCPNCGAKMDGGKET